MQIAYLDKHIATSYPNNVGTADRVVIVHAIAPTASEALFLSNSL